MVHILAGMGIGELLDKLSKLMSPKAQRNPNTPSAQLPHRPGLRVEATQDPSTTIAPSMLQQLIDQSQQQDPQQQMLQQLAARGGPA
jgi:hypothetical protein